MKKSGPYGTVIGNEIGAVAGENSMKVSQKKKTKELPRVPVIPLLGIYLTKMKTFIQKDMSSLMLIAALFNVTNIKINLCLSTDEWVMICEINTHTLQVRHRGINFVICNNMDGPVGVLYLVK